MEGTEHITMLLPDDLAIHVRAYVDELAGEGVAIAEAADAWLRGGDASRAN